MKVNLLLIVLTFVSLRGVLYAQDYHIRGVVTDSLNQGIPNTFVLLLPDSSSTITNAKGKFVLHTDNMPTKMICTHLQYDFWMGNEVLIHEVNNVTLKEKTKVLASVNIMGSKYKRVQEIGNIDVNAKTAYTMPSATGDFSKVLATLPGVVSNNEFSSTYTVRGGNYDENLIYVNGLKIYRPFLVSSGRQEGLGFVNPDLVGSVQFSAGGWQARYGDKLSSVLNVQYNEPKKTEATLNLSILGGSAYFGGTNKKKDFTYTVGVRHKNTKYLLGSLEVDGQYLPKFTDFQSYMTKRISDKTKIGVLLSSASNNYLIVPETQITEFGTINNSFRMTVAFEGREELQYNTHQFGTTLTHSFNKNMVSTLTLSQVLSTEFENYEVEGGYLLCDVNNDPSSNRFNECSSILGVGTNFNYGRNKLNANIFSVDQRNEIVIEDNLVEFGFSWDKEVFDDRLKEFSFIDSADFSQITRSVDNELHLSSHKITAYAQYTLNSANERHMFNIGSRVNYWSYSEQMLLSPRFQYAYYGGMEKNTVYRLSAGLYNQHPFYRELRNREGAIEEGVKAQESLHIVGGLEYFFNAWGRPFKLTSDLYYKYLWNVNPYEINNVRIRYYGTNQATAYAYGADFRVNGEFIEGVESWFSLGLLSTRENLGDGRGYIRRPSDQRMNLAIFFQDHMPGDPSLKVNVNFQYSSKFPFGPPFDDNLRNVFLGGEYYKLDMGFSKSITIESDKALIPKSLWIGLEVLNVLGANNTISYTWIQDVNSNYFAVPNALSARFLNIRLISKF